MKAYLYLLVILAMLVMILFQLEQPRYHTFQANIQAQIPSLGKQIRKGREQKKITAEHLADAIGLTVDQIASIENDRATPTRDLLSELEEKLQTEFVLY
jgi:ribosome-binding protein aMBF1 (putative translation factor)